MTERTNIAMIGFNRVELKESVRDRRVQTDGSIKEFKRREYWVFINCDLDGTTKLGNLTRVFGSKAEAIKYAKFQDLVQYHEERAC